MAAATASLRTILTGGRIIPLAARRPFVPCASLLFPAESSCSLAESPVPWRVPFSHHPCPGVTAKSTATSEARSRWSGNWTPIPKGSANNSRRLPADERSEEVVEAAGIEPASENEPARDPTGLVRPVISPRS